MTDRPTSADGRRERSGRTKVAVARAMMDLVRETQAIPTVDAVADRANVSRRSVFRHFPETSALIVAAADLQRAEVVSRFKPRDISALTVSERVRAVAQRLGRMNEYVTPLRSLVDRLRADHAVIDDMLREDRATYAHHFQSIFGDAFSTMKPKDREIVLEAMISASGWSTWRGLRKDQFLSVLAARKVVEHTLRALLRVDES